jgi:pimeloyl-ACP methyl ester carboxylesterase
MTHTDGIVKNLWGKFTRIMWSRSPAGKAIVFVHGFQGDCSTWEGFPSMILQESRLSSYDVFFLEYPWTERAASLSSEMKVFFNDLFTGPERIFASELRRIGREASNYTSVTIVAHCFGAIVTRLALLDAFDEGSEWVSKTAMVLFAPAHLGADIIAHGNSALGLFGQFVSVTPDALKIKFPSLVDLEPVPENITLQSLRSRTQQAIDSGVGQFTIAAEVLFGAEDRVAVKGQFCSDPPAKIIPAVGHEDICKPTSSFQGSFDSLVSHLL